MRILPIFVMALILTGCSESQSRVTQTPSPWTATAVGRIDSAEEARQLVAGVDGIIARIFVSRSEKVRAGQALAQIDCGPQLASVSARQAEVLRMQAAAVTIDASTPTDIQSTQAQISGAKARLVQESRQFERAQAVYSRGFLSNRDLDERQQRMITAQSDLASLEAKMEDLKSGSRRAERSESVAAQHVAAAEARVAESRARQCILRSPVDGHVLQIFRREGEFSGASQGHAILAVGNLDQIIVRAEINERDAAAIRAGQTVDIWTDGQTHRWTGHIVEAAKLMGRRTARSLDPTDRFDRDVREAIVAFDDDKGPALIGLRVTVGLRP